MTTLHREEQKQFRELFRGERIDRFNDRVEILDAFLGTEKHLTADELSRILKTTGRPFNVEFIADTMELLCRYGFARKNRFENGDIRYEHRHLGDHHDHMICTKCKKIIEFHDDALETLQRQISASHGFHMLQHKMEIYGICAACRSEAVSVIPLSAAKPGERLVIDGIDGGTRSKLRIRSMGLKTGDSVEVITNAGNGQLVVARDHQRYALGRGLATKIQVRRTDTESGNKQNTLSR
jgi:Fur family ferric uptake transcriptional regulator